MKRPLETQDVPQSKKQSLLKVPNTLDEHQKLEVEKVCISKTRLCELYLAAWWVVHRCKCAGRPVLDTNKQQFYYIGL
jgi:hypothetical protein